MQVDIFHWHNVRTEVKGDRLWFNVPDVCRVLELSNPTMAIRGIKESYLKKIEVATQYGNKESNFISDRGLIRLIQRSHSKLAGPFQDWTDERVEQLLSGKTVNAGGVVEESEDAMILRAITTLQNRVEAQAKELETARPKVDAYHVFLDSERLLHINFIAKKFKELGLHIGKEGFGGWLLSRGYLYDENANKVFKKKKKLRARTRWVRTGYLSEVDNSTDSYASYQVRVLPAGLFYFYETMCEEQGITPAPHKTVLEVIENIEEQGIAA